MYSMDEELLKIKNMVTTWYETYRKMEPHESNVKMFIFMLIGVLDPYLAALYRTNSIAPEDYSELMSYCEELVEKLKKELGLELMETVWDHISYLALA
ncbi:MAG: hypothetical protein QXJ68_07000 [Methanocellales archaeon]